MNLHVLWQIQSDGGGISDQLPVIKSKGTNETQSKLTGFGE